MRTSKGRMASGGDDRSRRICSALEVSEVLPTEMHLPWPGDKSGWPDPPLQAPSKLSAQSLTATPGGETVQCLCSASNSRAAQPEQRAWRRLVRAIANRQPDLAS